MTRPRRESSVSAATIAALAVLLFVLSSKKSQKFPDIKSNSRAIKYWPYVERKWYYVFLRKGKYFDDGFFRNPNDNLRTVKRVFDRLGHEMVNGSQEWDVLWSIEYPFEIFSEQMKNLTQHQRVNHFPGINYITYKAFMTTNNFFPFIPATFEFPHMLEEFKHFVKMNPEKKFVQKNGSNRGVKIVSTSEINFEKPGGKIYQEFIGNPLTIDGHAFDLGVYVLITSIEPLRIYR